GTTERLVDAALAHIEGRPVRIADVGTGAGVIGVTLAVAEPQVQVYATDINPAAVEIARENAARHGVADRVHVFEGDLLDPVPEPVEVVVANLPYLPEGEHDEAYDDEPPDAIYAPGDGLGPLRELLRRNPQLDPERIGDVILAATAQVGDQGLTLGRDVALLAGMPQSVPGFAIDRMCAGALTAVTAGAGEIALGACDVVVAGGIEHMGHHPMGADVDFNPRFVAERLVDMSAVTMGATAENLHDLFPQLTKEDADRVAV